MTDAGSRNFLVRLIVAHWTVKRAVKSPAMIEQEKYLFLYWKGVPFNRWMLCVSSFMVQFCCGSLYAWSNFNAPIDILIYGTRTANKAPNTFFMAFAMLGITGMIMGPWLEKHGPRQGLLLGTFCFALGQGVTAFSLLKKSIIGVYLGYGVVSGFGLALNYMSPVSPLQKFFPDYRGVASGLAVAGFGAGSIVWSKVYLPLMDAVELPLTFVILGVLLSGIMLPCTIVMRTPPDDFTAGGLNIYGEKVLQQRENGKSGSGSQHGQELKSAVADDRSLENAESGVEKSLRAEGSVPEMTLIQSICSPDFVFMYLTLFANQVFGAVTLSRLANMAQELFGQTRTEGTNIVSINGVFNCLGRLLLPVVGDVAISTLAVNPSFSRKCVFIFSLGMQVIIIAVLPQLIRSDNYGGFRVTMWTLTFTYGGGIGTIPCFLTDMFGPYNIGALHGIILSSWAIGGVGGGLGFTTLFDQHKPAPLPPGQSYPRGAFERAYTSNFDWIRGVLICGMIVLLFVRTNPIDRRAPGWRYSIFGKKIIHINRRKSVEPDNLTQ